MAAFPYQNMQAVATQLIADAGMAGVLRRLTDNPTDRPCTICIYDYAPRDPETQLANPTLRKVLISITGLLSEPPDNEQDTVIPSLGPDANAVLRFVQPVKIYAPAGIVICYDCVVRR
jgi:hypothetical protein